MSKSLYIVIPCYNEQEVLPITAPMFLEKINSLIEKGLCNENSKVLFVNDGSKDDTWNIIQQLAEQHEKQAADRQSQVGSGDRSERIRTYNFPQGRVSDHRIGLTIYKLDAFLDGDIDDIVDPLITAQQAEKMKNF